MGTKLSYIQSICTNWSEDTGVFWEYKTDQNKPKKLSKFVLVISSFWILTLKINLVFPISLLIPSVYHKLYHSVPHQSVSLSVSRCTTSKCIPQCTTSQCITDHKARSELLCTQPTHPLQAPVALVENCKNYFVYLPSKCQISRTVSNLLNNKSLVSRKFSIIFTVWTIPWTLHRQTGANICHRQINCRTSLAYYHNQCVWY